MGASQEAQFKLGSFEVSVYTKTFWMEKLALMDLTMLTCLSLPECFVHREKPEFALAVRSVPLKREQLFETSKAYAEFTWLKARRLLHVGDCHKSCKNVSYVFRVL